MTLHKLEMETCFTVDKIANTNMYAITLLYADPAISPNYSSLGTIIFVGTENEAKTHYDLLAAGEPVPCIRRVLEDLYEKQLKDFLFPRLFGI